MQIAVEIPDSIVDPGGLPRAELEAEVRKELAIFVYSRGALSEGKAAELAALNRWEFSKLLGERGIKRNYDEEDLEHDLEWAKKSEATEAVKSSAAPLKKFDPTGGA